MDDEKAKFLALFIKESEEIEGFPKDILYLKQEIAVGKKYGHVGALLFAEEMGEGQGVLSEENICYIQKLILIEEDQKADDEVRIHPAMIGVYRKVRVRFEGMFAPPPDEVPRLMAEFAEKLKRFGDFCNNPLSHEAKIRKIAELHLEFLRIHPFGGGNGRTARVLAYYMFRFHRIYPFVFTAADKFSTYHAAFNDKSGKAMKEYFLKRTLNR